MIGIADPFACVRYVRIDAIQTDFCHPVNSSVRVRSPGPGELIISFK
jgi:hypothetical protein